MKESLINQLVKHLFDHKDEWHAKGNLLLREWRDKRGTRYMADTVSRKLREAEENSLIAVKYDGRTTLYKWLPHERRASYIPTSERTDDRLFVIH